MNLAAAKESGIPYICMPVFTFNRFWLVTHKLWLPLIRLLPTSWTESWIDYSVPDFLWDKKFSPFKELGCDMVMLVAPGKNTIYVADPRAISQITTRRNDFPKPTWQYTSVDLFGRSVVSTEGAIWRTHRKITSPPFTEKNNLLVWKETLSQAESMMTELVGNKERSGSIWSVESEAMRLSLHVISRAGFGVRLHWPHENADDAIPEGHTMTYKGALETLLHQILVIILTPRWFLQRSPFKIHKLAYEGLTEWGKYMQEMYDQKKSEVKYGENREGMDLLGALVKGAGLANMEGQDNEKGSKQILTDEEILGNAFVFILGMFSSARLISTTNDICSWPRNSRQYDSLFHFVSCDAHVFTEESTKGPGQHLRRQTGNRLGLRRGLAKVIRKHVRRCHERTASPPRASDWNSKMHDECPTDFATWRQEVCCACKQLGHLEHCSYTQKPSILATHFGEGSHGVPT